jgi:hypothetical protein
MSFVYSNRYANATLDLVAVRRHRANGCAILCIRQFVEYTYFSTA